MITIPYMFNGIFEFVNVFFILCLILSNTSSIWGAIEAKHHIKITWLSVCLFICLFVHLSLFS